MCWQFTLVSTCFSNENASPKMSNFSRLLQRQLFEIGYAARHFLSFMSLKNACSKTMHSWLGCFPPLSRCLWILCKYLKNDVSKQILLTTAATLKPQIRLHTV